MPGKKFTQFRGLCTSCKFAAKCFDGKCKLIGCRKKNEIVIESMPHCTEYREKRTFSIANKINAFISSLIFTLSCIFR